jgi:hypothetical protein
MRWFALLAAAALGCGAAPSSNDPGTTTADPPPSNEETPPTVDEPPALEYPSGPYGKAQGNVFPDVAFEGYRDGDGEWTTLHMLDLFDPDGAKGVRGIYVVVAAQWCGVCQQEAMRLPKSYPAWKGRGARFLMVLGQDNARKPALQSTVDAWQSRFHLPFDVGADPKLEFLPPGATGFPTCYVIDPRTMKIVRVLPGVTSDGSIPGLDAVIKRNGG